MPNQQYDTGVSRYDRLQSSIEALTRDVGDTMATVRSLAGTVGAIAQRQDRLESLQRDSSRLNWAPVSIVATVMIAVATLSGGLIAYAISAEARARVTGDEHLDRLYNAVLEDNLAEVRRRIERLESPAHGK